MPNAESRIRTLYPAAPWGSVTKIALKDLEKYDPRDAGALRAGFSLILGLVLYISCEQLLPNPGSYIFGLALACPTNSNCPQV